MKKMDNKLFKVEEVVAMEMGTMKAYFKDDDIADDYYSFYPYATSPWRNAPILVTFIKTYLELKAEPDADNKIKACNEKIFWKPDNIKVKELWLAA